MQEDIASLGLLRYNIQWSSISTDYNYLSIHGGKFVRVAFQRSVADQKRFYTYTVILIDNPFSNLVDLYLITDLIGTFKSMQAKINIYRIRRLNVLGHISNSLWTKDS